MYSIYFILINIYDQIKHIKIKLNKNYIFIFDIDI